MELSDAKELWSKAEEGMDEADRMETMFSHLAGLLEDNAEELKGPKRLILALKKSAMEAGKAKTELLFFAKDAKKIHDAIYARLQREANEARQNPGLPFDGQTH